ncbi:MAG: YceI family protein [Candidatus Acidiferrales bacterium]
MRVRLASRLRGWALLAAIQPALWMIAALPARAQDTVYTLDAAQTQIHYELSATLHTVHGVFKLKSGKIRFDAHTGKASGAIVVDATSGNSGTESRDAKMHASVIESAKYPEFVFTPTHVKGAIPSGHGSPGASQMEVQGTFRIHGQDHPLILIFQVQPPSGGELRASTNFSIPYVQWGMKNPSTFLLHVGEQVDVEVQAEGRLSETQAEN